MELLRNTGSQGDLKIIPAQGQGDDEGFERVRCPLCEWRPAPSSSWCCGWSDDTPEPPFNWCGTSFHTFRTRGRCPGCQHQWQWTSCLSCHEWSLHEDWYECG
jgi:hypothetical protein